MKICDICFEPADLKQVYATEGPPSYSGMNTPKIWDKEMPDLCPTCMELLRQKAWIAIGEKYRDRLQSFMSAIPEADKARVKK